MIKTIKQLTAVAEGNDWRVNEEDWCGAHYHFFFSQFSDYGQDFSFSASGNTIRELVADAEKYAENFDTDEAASYWIGADGHGKNGAPYRISDILADMEECKQSMLDLVSAWKNY